jgi:exosortase
VSVAATVSPAPPAHARRGYRSSSPLILLALALGALWFVCCRHLSSEWSYNEQYNYGWFVPFFALYLFWLRWEDRPRSAGADVSHQRSEVSPEIQDPESSIQNAEVRGPDDQPRPAREIRDSKFEIRNLIAFAIAVPTLLALFPLRLIEVANPDWRLLSWAHALAAVSLTLLLIWWIGGKPWLKHFAFPVAFFLVAVPWLSGIEQPIIQGLMPTIATIATETLSLFGIPAEVQGNLIRIGEGVVGVNEACSGVRSLQTSLMIGLLFGELTRLSIPRRSLLIIAALGIAFVANCGRAFFLVYIAATQGVPQVEHWHDIAGYAIVGLVFFGCLGVAKLLGGNQKSVVSGQMSDDNSQSAVSEQTSEVSSGKVSSFDLELVRIPSLAATRAASPSISLTPGRSIRHSSFPRSFLAAALFWLLLIEIGCEGWYRSHERNLQKTAVWNVRWPESAPDFKEIKIDDRSRSILHYDEGRGASWRGGSKTETPSVSDRMSLLYFFRWHPGHNSALLANAHRPDVCLPASGWKQIGDHGVRNYEVAPGFTIPFRHFEFGYEGPGRTRVAHAFYVVWEDRVNKSAGDGAHGMHSDPSAWTRRERIDAVRNGRRHLGQQVMEFLVIQGREVSPAEAQEAFAAEVRQLIATNPPS